MISKDLVTSDSCFRLASLGSANGDLGDTSAGRSSDSANECTARGRCRPEGIARRRARCCPVNEAVDGLPDVPEELGLRASRWVLRREPVDLERPAQGASRLRPVRWLVREVDLKLAVTVVPVIAVRIDNIECQTVLLAGHLS